MKTWHTIPIAHPQEPLPHDILPQIFHHLPPSTLISTISQICTEWRHRLFLYLTKHTQQALIKMREKGDIVWGEDYITRMERIGVSKEVYVPVLWNIIGAKRLGIGLEVQVQEVEVAMFVKEADFRVGESKIGGYGHVLEGEEVVEIDCQINLRELTVYDVRCLFPDSGVLMFLGRDGVRYYEDPMSLVQKYPEGFDDDAYFESRRNDSDDVQGPAARPKKISSFKVHTKKDATFLSDIDPDDIEDINCDIEMEYEIDDYMEEGSHLYLSSFQLSPFYEHYYTINSYIISYEELAKRDFTQVKWLDSSD